MTNTKKNSPGRHAKFTDAFKAEAVRLARTSGRPLRAISDDLGVGLSTLGKWVSAHKEADLLSGPHEDTAKELARLRKENEILRQERDLLKKAGRLLCKGNHEMKFKVIAAEKANVPVQRACTLLGVSESGYYAWDIRKPSLRQRTDMVLLAHIRAQFTTSHETYGSPRMTVELKEDGVCVGRHRVARIMHDNGLKALQKRRFKRTTDSDHKGPVTPNILDQDFAATGPNQKWGVDITYVWTTQGWLYLAIVVDLYSRRIIGWATSDRMKQDLALTALRRAIAIRRPPKDVIHHSDRGSQYCATDYQKLLKAHGFILSMSGKGNCYDNSMVETVFKTIKSELVWRTVFKTRTQAEIAIGQYIDAFYNPKRRHSSLGYKSPIQFESIPLKLTP
ncbi:IS3 family transposase (plasmid) [Agrobacterium vitis]|uniref:IS3 family transposase n=1 Tax=Agrobacterium vitis TaxID=373 RepID=UPI003D2BA055